MINSEVKIFEEIVSFFNLDSPLFFLYLHYEFEFQRGNLARPIHLSAYINIDNQSDTEKVQTHSWVIVLEIK